MFPSRLAKSWICPQEQWSYFMTPPPKSVHLVAQWEGISEIVTVLEYFSWTPREELLTLVYVYIPINQECNITFSGSHNSCHWLSIYNVTGNWYTISFNPPNPSLRQVWFSPLSGGTNNRVGEQWRAWDTEAPTDSAPVSTHLSWRNSWWSAETELPHGVTT